jgi:hypothetical protein
MELYKIKITSSANSRGDISITYPETESRLCDEKFV